MKDDSLNDTQEDKMALRGAQTRDGGYCPMCDTVYDRPHECVGKQMQKAQDEMDDYQLPEGNKTTYRLVNIDKALDTNVYERKIWNEAIEAAAVMLETTNLNDKDDSEEVRKLKK